MRNLCIIALSFFMVQGMALGKTRALSPEKSKIVWTGKKVTGEHTGTIKMKEGSIVVKDGKLVEGKVTIDMTTINNTDLEGKWKKKLEGHLESPDFFNTKEHKVATFESKSIKPSGEKGYKVSGTLTIKGKSNPVDFILAETKEGYKGRLTFDRTKYGIKYGSGDFFDDLGDKLIYNDVELEITLATK